LLALLFSKILWVYVAICILRFFVLNITIVLIELVKDFEERYTPSSDRIFLIFADDCASHLEAFGLASEEIKVSTQIIVLDSEGAILRKVIN
jgi:hypothetical protein